MIKFTSNRSCGHTICPAQQRRPCCSFCPWGLCGSWPDAPRPGSFRLKRQCPSTSIWSSCAASTPRLPLMKQTLFWAWELPSRRNPLGSNTSPATLIPYPGKPSSTCRSQKVSGNSPSVIGSHWLSAEVISIVASLSCWNFSLSWALARWRNRPSPMESAHLGDEWCMRIRWLQPLASWHSRSGKLSEKHCSNVSVVIDLPGRSAAWAWSNGRRRKLLLPKPELRPRKKLQQKLQQKPLLEVKALQCAPCRWTNRQPWMSWQSWWIHRLFCWWRATCIHQRKLWQGTWLSITPCFSWRAVTKLSMMPLKQKFGASCRARRWEERIKCRTSGNLFASCRCRMNSAGTTWLCPSWMKPLIGESCGWWKLSPASPPWTKWRNAWRKPGRPAGYLVSCWCFTHGSFTTLLTSGIIMQLANAKKPAVCWSAMSAPKVCHCNPQWPPCKMHVDNFIVWTLGRISSRRFMWRCHSRPFHPGCWGVPDDLQGRATIVPGGNSWTDWLKQAEFCGEFPPFWGQTATWQSWQAILILTFSTAQSATVDCLGGTIGDSVQCTDAEVVCCTDL